LAAVEEERVADIDDITDEKSLHAWLNTRS